MAKVILFLIPLRTCYLVLLTTFRAPFLDWLFERIKLDSSISMIYVRNTAQLEDMLTTGAFTTRQWKSLVRLLGIRPPSNLSVDRSLSESSCSVVSPKKNLLAMSNATSQRDLWKSQGNINLVPQAPLWRNPVFYSSSHAWRNPMRSSEQARPESDAYWQEVCRETQLKGKT